MRGQTSTVAAGAGPAMAGCGGKGDPLSFLGLALANF